jgi:hypothetical protein
MGQRLLVVSNGAKNLVGSSPWYGPLPREPTRYIRKGGICRTTDAPIGEVVTFEGLPAPEPLLRRRWKRKIFWLVWMV